MANAPLKVSRRTKETVRLGAAILACSQGEFIDRAVAEYLERHAEEMPRRVEAAREAMLAGDDQLTAFLLEIDADAVRRVTP